MKVKSFLIKNSLLLVLILSIFLKIIETFPLDNQILSGADTSSHLFKAWYISENGVTKWNYYWYGGDTFLRYYAPLSYYFSGYLGKLFGYLLSYKLVVNLFFVLTPVAFYMFLKEFKLQDKYVALSLLVFSLIPIHNYYFFDGRHPALISFFFSILYWKFLKRSVDNKEGKYTVLSAVFLSLSILSHVLIGVLIIGISLLWLLTYNRKINTLIRFFKLGVLVVFLTSWWAIPFFIETQVTKVRDVGDSDYTNIIENKFTFETFRGYLSFMSPYYISEFSEYFIWGSTIFLIFLCLVSLSKIKDENVKSFLVVLALVAVLLFLLRYKRASIFAPIPISILVPYAIFNLKKAYKLLIFILVIILALSYFSIEGYTYNYPETPDIPKDGRVIYLPLYITASKKVLFDASLFAPMNGNEFILGWYPQSQDIGKSAPSKVMFNSLIVNPLSIGQEEYYEVLKDGWVNYLVVNKQNPELMKYFGNNKAFKVYNNTDTFLIYEISPKSSYLEIDGKDVIDFELIKEMDKISINFTCNEGNLTIKESYHERWIGILNGKEINLNWNKNGFMQTYLNYDGYCRLELKFEDAWYHKTLIAVSMVSYIFILLYLISGSKKII